MRDFNLDWLQPFHPKRWLSRKGQRFPASHHRLSPAWWISLCVAGGVIGSRQMGALEQAELQILDTMVQIQPATPTDSRLLVVEVTEEDIQKHQRWPLPDAVLAKVLGNLQVHRPRVIGLDIFRDIPHPPGEAQLVQQLRSPNVIGIQTLGSSSDRVYPPPSMRPEQIGISNVPLDTDGTVRRGLLLVKTGQQTIYSFALRLSLAYLRQSSATLLTYPRRLQIGDIQIPVLTPNAGNFQNLDSRGHQILLRYPANSDVIRRIDLNQVLTGQFDPAWVRDKLVIIGTTAPSGKDLFLTPRNRSSTSVPMTAGVLIHADISRQLLQSVLDRRPTFRFWEDWVEQGWIVGWAIVGGSIAWWIRHPWGLMASVGVACGGLGGIGFSCFLNALWIPIVSPGLALLFTSVSVLVYRQLHEAFHDPLTHLPNRNLFIKQLQQTIAQRALIATSNWPLAGQPTWKFPVPTLSPQPPAPLTLLFVGLDSFKAINDTFGHFFGDALLTTVTDRIQACLQPMDYLARVGGDEFVILRPYVRDISEVTHLASALQRQMADPFQLDGRSVFTTASIGIVLDRVDSNYQPEDLLRDAQTAMHRAKALGKSRYEVFVTKMRTQLMARIQMETDLHYALEREEFQLYYQPLVCLESGQIIGFEALVRWYHPEKGFISPVEFIPIAEEVNLILPLGQWILQQACQQLRQWQDKYQRDRPLCMSVNLSGKQFAQPDLVDQIEAHLIESGIESRSLKLEITETVAMAEVETAIAVLMRLKALNLQLSIDDFGTGYSSLSYLHHFPTSTLKVDRTFVSRMGPDGDNTDIVKTIIMLGQNLGMEIVAEGVEQPEQLAALREMGCEYGQGYFFSRPLPPSEAEELLRANPCW